MGNDYGKRIPTEAVDHGYSALRRVRQGRHPPAQAGHRGPRRLAQRRHQGTQPRASDMSGILKYWINELHDPVTGERFHDQNYSAMRAINYSTNAPLPHGIRSL